MSTKLNTDSVSASTGPNVDADKTTRLTRQVFVSLFVLPALAPLGQLVAHGVVALRLVGSRLRLPRLLIFGWQPPRALVAIHAEAALPRHPDQPWVGAGGRGGREIGRAHV